MTQPAWQPEPPPEAPPQSTVPLSEVQRIVEQALERQAEQHRADIAELRDSLTPAVNPFPVDHLVPEHSGGPGLTVAQTWSLYDQELAQRGEHPLQQAQAGK